MWLIFVGRQYNKDGELHEWWSKKSVDKFKDLQSCFISQYGNFSSPEAEGMRVHPVSIRLIVTACKI